MIYRKYIKRVLDFVMALSIIVVFGWLLLIVAVVILITDGSPVIYRQERVGQFGRSFSIYKFRTMVKNAEKIGPKATASGDTRITPIGRILRKTSLDELPQILNILKGEMSFVGYRPGVPENYNSNDYNSGMFSVKPGITGYAQVNGRSNLTLEEKRGWELKYVKDVSFFTDIKIIIETVRVVLGTKGTN